MHTKKGFGHYGSTIKSTMKTEEIFTAGQITI